MGEDDDKKSEFKIDSVTFLASLEDGVDSAIFRRGLGYYQSNLVHSVRFLNDADSSESQNFIRVSGVVRGTQSYKTAVGIKNSLISEKGVRSLYF